MVSPLNSVPNDSNRGIYKQHFWTKTSDLRCLPSVGSLLFVKHILSSPEQWLSFNGTVEGTQQRCPNVLSDMTLFTSCTPNLLFLCVLL